MEFIDTINLCTGCGIPVDEMPDTVAEWRVQAIPIEELTDPTCQGYVRCSNEPQCPGHLVERRMFCVRCQEEKKHEVPAHPDS
jgi:hypothetical protein